MVPRRRNPKGAGGLRAQAALRLVEDVRHRLPRRALPAHRKTPARGAHLLLRQAPMRHEKRAPPAGGARVVCDLGARPETPREAKTARRCKMWRRKAAVVVPLLQGLTASQIAPHSRFAVVSGFPAGALAWKPDRRPRQRDGVVDGPGTVTGGPVATRGRERSQR